MAHPHPQYIYTQPGQAPYTQQGPAPYTHQSQVPYMPPAPQPTALMATSTQPDDDRLPILATDGSWTQLSSGNGIVPVITMANVTVQQGSNLRLKRQWATGLFDCCADMGTCCGVCFCAPCYLCMLSSRMEEGCCMPCWVPGAAYALRTKLRTSEHIKGTILKDCCIMCGPCGPCALCQLKREHDLVLKARIALNLR